MRRFSIRARIILLIVLAALLAGGVGAAYHSILLRVVASATAITEDRLLKREEDKLRVATHSMAVAIGTLVKPMSDPEARLALIRAAIADVRFEDDQSGYYFVYQKTVNVAHPLQKDLQGKERGSVKDPNGFEYIRDLSQKAVAGGGFTRYVFDKPGQGKVPKLAYAETIPGTDYWIATGVYVDNLERMTAEAGQSLLAETGRLTRLALGGAAALFLLVALPLSWAIFRSVAGPLAAVTAKAGRVAEGNLDERLTAEGRDEIAQLEGSLARMVGSLKERVEEAAQRGRAAQAAADEAERALVRAREAETRAEAARREGVARAADAVASAVESLAQASGRLAGHVDRSGAGAARQSERGEETATAVREMNATVLEVARNASAASEGAAKARDDALAGAGVVEQAARAIEQASREAAGLAQSMDDLHGRADSIGNILAVISDIADQTNLLALNAAIEAARAGDAGRGFAVVADEVRKLAEKTVSATKEVERAVKAIQEGVRASGGQVGQASRAAEEAAGLARASGDSLRTIVAVAESSADQIRAIATAAEEQSAASEEIARSVEDVALISRDLQETMQSSIQELARLDEQVRGLKKVLEGLRAQSGEERP